jgi:hypothetical protein
MGGQIIDATVIEARRPRLSQAEKDTIKGGGTPAEWEPARRAQIDGDGRWTIKRGRKREVAPGDGHNRQVEIAVPVFGYKNHVGIDRAFGFCGATISPTRRLVTAASSARYSLETRSAVLPRLPGSLYSVFTPTRGSYSSTAKYHSADQRSSAESRPA